MDSCYLSAHPAPATAAHVLVSASLWSSLSSATSSSIPRPASLLVAIESKYPVSYTSSEATGTTSTLLVRAELASPKFLATLPSTSELPTVFVPPALRSSHPSIFGRPRPSNESPLPSLLLSLAHPIVLSSIVLVSHDTGSYELASKEFRTFETRLKVRGDVLRQGDTLELSEDAAGEVEGVSSSWSIVMTDPVLQGVYKEGLTRFLVLPPQQGDTGKGRLAITNGDEQKEETGEEDQGEEEEGDEFEIDESFLANSVLTPPPSAFLALPPVSPLKGEIIFNGTTLAPAPLPSSGTLITPLALLHPIPSCLLIPRPADDEDDHPRCYLRTSDLGRLGIFSGDWVRVQCEKGGRLVRAFAREGIVGDSTTEVVDPVSITVYFPPALLHNLLGPAPFLLPIHLSPMSAAPQFPTAKSVTVARIASPHSVHRAFQTSFLDALKDYFKVKERVLKKGDLVAVGIESEGARFGEGRTDEEDYQLPSSSSTPTALVFFQITSLEVSSPTPTPTDDDPFLAELDSGNFGCFVDPKVTKLVQTGLERSLVPDVEGFMGLPNPSPVNISVSILGDPTPTSRLFEYVQASLRPGSDMYDLHLTVLMRGARGSGKRTIVRSIARKTGFHLLELDCFDLLGETELKTEGHLRAKIDRAITCSPCLLLLRNIEALARKSQALETGQEPAMSTILRECFATARAGWKSTGFPIIILATTCDVDKIPTAVLGSFKEEISVEAPGEAERLAILRALTANDVVAPDASLRALAIQTAALVANDLVDLLRRARASATSRILVSNPSLSALDIARSGMTLTSMDFNIALEKSRNSYSESIGAPKIPSVTWDDVGGLGSVKDDILDTIQLPLERPELFADGLKKRSGILLYGPPGTGKTLLAKAVATSCSLNFFSIKGPELLDMYIGESEANVRRVFQRARDAKPCVIFFDELDSVAPKRGNQGDSGGVMDRIVSQLLAELDGMAEGKGGSDVFVIGATNRPDLLDPALLRPGRFDRMLYLGVSDNHDSQLKIIQALTRKFKLDPNIQLENVAQMCPFNYTGADFYALCSDAMLKAMTRKAEEIDAKLVELNSRPPHSTGPPLTPQYYLAEMATPSEIEVLVSQLDFEAALSELVPSVSKAEMEHYKVVQQRFSGETMNSEEKIAQKQIQAAGPPTRESKGKGKAVGN